MALLLSGCFSTIKPAKQIDDNQKIIAKEEKKVDNTLVEIEKNDKGKRIQTSGLSVGIQHSLNQVTNAPVQVDTARKLLQITSERISNTSKKKIYWLKRFMVTHHPWVFLLLSINQKIICFNIESVPWVLISLFITTRICGHHILESVYRSNTNYSKNI